MKTNCLSRRQFLERSAAATSALLLSSYAALGRPSTKRTAVDQVTLGKTGLKLSRLCAFQGHPSGLRCE